MIAIETMKDIERLPQEEFELLAQSVNERKLKDMRHDIDSLKNKIIDEKNAREQLETTTSIIQEEHKKQGETIIEIKNEIDVLGAPLHSKRKKNFKKICSSRVWTLLNNDMASCEYIIFSSFFFKKIYSDISNHFDLDTYMDLNMKNYSEAGSKYSEAKEIAQSWTPSSYYIRTCIEDLIEKRDKGFLKPERCRALSEYLRITNNNELNPFN